MKKVETKLAPKAIWPYSQGYIIWDLFYSSGQIALNPETMEMENKNLEQETRRVCENIWGLLKEIWLDFKNVFKTTVFLDDMNDFAKVNEIYAEYFSHKPARSCVEVAALPKNAKVEIEIIASLK